MDYPFFGMRGTGDWRTNQRPEHWREGIMRMYPNGDAPLTAIISMLTTEGVDDPHFHWFDKELPDQSCSVLGVYTDAALTTPYLTGGVAGDTLYFNISEDDVDKFRPTHVVMMRYSGAPDMDVNTKVTSRSKNGASSYIACLLLEADDNNVTYNLSATNVAWIIGSAYPEGSLSGDSIMYDPTEHENLCQIFKTPLEHTRTATKTKLRTGKQVQQAKAEALELHGIEMEKANIFGKMYSRTGSNGKPERYQAGIRSFITTNRYDFVSDGGGAWLANAEDWMDEKLEIFFRYAKREVLGLCGNGVLIALNQVARQRGTFEMTKMVGAYGMNIVRWVTPVGEIYLKTHPLFNQQSTTRNSMMLVTPENLVWRPIDDTFYEPDIQANDLDGEKSQWVTEGGLELHHEKTFAWFDGIGLASHPKLTTAPPTTTAPSTATATTAAASTAAPSTAGATSAAPTSAAPTTVTATTLVATTVAPTTVLVTTATPTSIL